MSMSRNPVVRPRRVEERPSRVVTALFLAGLLIVSSAVTAALLLPTSLEDWAVTAAIAATFDAIGLAIHALRERMTRKRRRDRLGG